MRQLNDAGQHFPEPVFYIKTLIIENSTGVLQYYSTTVQLLYSLPDPNKELKRQNYMSTSSYIRLDIIIEL